MKNHPLYTTEKGVALTELTGVKSDKPAVCYTQSSVYCESCFLIVMNPQIFIG